MTQALSVVSDEKEKEHLQKVINRISKDEEGFLAISLNDNKTVSYARFKNDKINEAKRVKTTLGRYLTRIFDVKVKDKTLSDFTTEVLKLVSSEQELDAEIKELSDKDIMDFYETNDDSSCGGLSSCMSGESASYTELYALNSDKVKLIVFGNRARALLWTTDDGTKVLDRYYPSQSKYGELLRQWAKNKGYVLRNNPDSLVTSGSVSLSDNKQHIITLKHNDVFPYLDTFKFGKIINDKVQISNYSNFGDIVLDMGNGGYRELKCYNCGKYLPSTSLVEQGDETYCISCFDEIFFTCDICKRNYEQRDELNFVNDETICNGCLNYKYFTCDNCNETTLNSEAVMVNEHQYCADCASSENVIECDKCGDKYSSENLMIILDENNNQLYYCEYDLQFAQMCDKCGDYFSYELKEGFCKNCKPELYSKQSEQLSPISSQGCPRL